MHGMSTYPKGTSIIFDGNEWKKLAGPLVYIAWQQTTALYVGVTTNGVRRPMDPAHHAESIISGASHIELYQFNSINIARAFEKEMITDLQPLYNTQGILNKADNLKPVCDVVILKINATQELRRKLKARALEEGRTVTAVMIRAITNYLSTPIQ